MNRIVQQEALSGGRLADEEFRDFISENGCQSRNNNLAEEAANFGASSLSAPISRISNLSSSVFVGILLCFAKNARAAMNRSWTHEIWLNEVRVLSSQYSDGDCFSK